jgi:thiamine pyrophosphokinase
MIFNPFTILLGGTCVPTPRLLAQVKNTRVIAADGGIAHAKILGLEPELWVGDFDSTSAELEAEYPHMPREQFDVAKAKSDGELAIEAAQSRGANALVLVGALGGARSDHQMMILTNAIALAARGMPVILTSGAEEAAPVGPGEMRVELPSGTIFSVIGLTDLEGLTIEGARWPLTDCDVPFGSTLTLSNEANGPVSLTLRGGKAVMFANFRTES